VDPTPTTRSSGCIMQRKQFFFFWFPGPDGFNELQAFSHVFLACFDENGKPHLCKSARDQERILMIVRFFGFFHARHE